MRRIRIRPRAESDLDEIFDFPAASDLAVAIRFHGNVRRTLHEVAAMDDPGLRWESNDARLLNVRFWKVSGFPNHLLFFTAARVCVGAVISKLIY